MKIKVLKDTLQKPNGRFDKQALQMFASFVLTVIFGAYIVASDYFLDREINRYAIDVFFGFVFLSGGQAAFNIWNKKVDRKLYDQMDCDPRGGSYYPGNNPYNPQDELFR